MRSSRRQWSSFSRCRLFSFTIVSFGERISTGPAASGSTSCACGLTLPPPTSSFRHKSEGRNSQISCSVPLMKLARSASVGKWRIPCPRTATKRARSAGLDGASTCAEWLTKCMSGAASELLYGGSVVVVARTSTGRLSGRSSSRVVKSWYRSLSSGTSSVCCSSVCGVQRCRLGMKITLGAARRASVTCDTSAWARPALSAIKDAMSSVNVGNSSSAWITAPATCRCPNPLAPAINSRGRCVCGTASVASVAFALVAGPV
mmetsp:Transcript_29147/g.78199  ORF Transcript_29147/g.78199 Transcript_29147/m.78199 type:complete len:261 (-) Transcript_29147:1288-2070(-)